MRIVLLGLFCCGVCGGFVGFFLGTIVSFYVRILRTKNWYHGMAQTLLFVGPDSLARKMCIKVPV